MQPIERYGVIALCFLFVTVAAVWMWDDHTDGALAGSNPAQRVAGAPRNAIASKPAAKKNTAPNKKSQRREPRRQPNLDERSAGLRSKKNQVVPGTPAAGSLAAGISGTTGVEPGAFTPERMRARKEAQAQAERERRRAEEETLRKEFERRQRQAAEEKARLASAAEEEDRKAFANRGASKEIPSLEPKKQSSTQKRSNPKRSSTTRVANGGLRPYVIRASDTLTEIAQRELGTMHRWKEITAANPGLNPALLPVGVEILLPTGKAPSSSNAKSARSNTGSKNGKASGATITVRGGDSLWRIAERELGNGARWSEIAGLNPSIDPDRLHVGAVLRLPSGSKQKKSSPKDSKSTFAERPRVAQRTPQRQESRSRGKVL